MPEKKVDVKVVTDVNQKRVEALEDTLRKLKQKKLKLEIDASTKELEETEQKIQNLKIFLDTVNTGNTNINIDDSQIIKAREELAALESDKIDLEIAVESGKLESAKAEIEDLDGTEIDVNVISQGFSRLKEGALEIKDAFGEILGAAGAQEMNKTFLEMNLGAQGAASAMKDINSIVANLPGDDTALQGLLSQAAAKNAGITRGELEGMATAATDYFSAMSFYGKSATEAQQDMTNYILAGNTAELERSPILQGHIDKLKEGTTIQERSKLLQEALNEAGWGGISQQDTYNNKLETFNGMLERGKYTLGGMFQEGAKGAMDFALGLDEATNGMVGISFALLDFASPLTDSVMGLGQMATGFKAIKDLGIISWFKDLELVTKLSAAADWLLSGAQAVLNFVMSMNPIVLVVIALVALAAALIWAYYNVDWFRESVDNLFSTISSFVSGAITYLQNFTNSLGLNANDWKQVILGFILFLPQLPMKLGETFVNALAKTLGFGNNFVASLRNTASKSVSNFISYISSLPGKLWNELQRMYRYVNDWAATLPAKFWEAGVNAVKNFLNALGIHSPGTMQRMMIWEVSEMGRRVPVEAKQLISNIGQVATDVVTAFNPELNDIDFSDVSDISFKLGDVEFANNNLIAEMESLKNSHVNDAGNGDTIINIYGDVDSDKRVREIVEAVRQELSWNNITAGRTV